MDASTVISLVVLYSSPLLLAGLGELLVERTGLVNLGVEGIVALGAAVAAAIGVLTGSWAASYLAAAASGALLALLFYAFTSLLEVSQIVVGLSLFFLGLGLSEIVGASTSGLPAPLAPRIYKSLDPLSIAALVLALLLWLYLYHTWSGYALRSIGESIEAARALGVRVLRTRLYASLAQGLLAGAAGAQILLALHYARWYSGITTGWGWLALGVVVLGYWHPLGVLVASFFTASLFTLLQPMLATLGAPPALASTSPYLAVIAALAAMSSLARRLGVSPPATVWREE